VSSNRVPVHSASTCKVQEYGIAQTLSPASHGGLHCHSGRRIATSVQAVRHLHAECKLCGAPQNERVLNFCSQTREAIQGEASGGSDRG